MIIKQSSVFLELTIFCILHWSGYTSSPPLTAWDIRQKIRFFTLKHLKEALPLKELNKCTQVHELTHIQ